MRAGVPDLVLRASFDFGNPDDIFQSLIITTLPATGSLYLAAGASAPGAVIAGQVVSAADIAFLTYAPALNAFGPASASFTLQVVDDDGTANGGQNTDQLPNTMTIDITPEDDAPVLDTNAGMTVLEGATTTITTAMLSSSDVDTLNGNIVYTVTSSVANGQLELATAPGVAITSFTQDDLANGRVVYVHDSSETLSDSFTFTVADATTTLAPAVFNITVTPVNDEPAGADNTVSTLEDTNLVFSSADFGFSDLNDSPSHLLQSVIITTLPATGTLFLDTGASVTGPVTAGQVIAEADLQYLTYTPALNAHGAGAASFTFQVVDDGGTANGGVNTDQTPNTMTVDVTSVPGGRP